MFFRGLNQVEEEGATVDACEIRFSHHRFRNPGTVRFPQRKYQQNPTNVLVQPWFHGVVQGFGRPQEGATRSWLGTHVRWSLTPYSNVGT